MGGGSKSFQFITILHGGVSQDPKLFLHNKRTAPNKISYICTKKLQRSVQAERLLLTELTTLASVFVSPRSFINKIIMGKYFIFSAQTKLLTVRGANSGTKYVLCGIPGEEPVFTFGSLVHSLGGSKLGSF